MANPDGRREVDLSPQERLFAAEVGRARAGAKVSQDWVGRRIGLSRGKVSEVCGGRYLPTRETLILLAEALGMERERTFRLWQDAREARDQRRRLERLDRQATVPVSWDRLPALPVEVLSLLRAQVGTAEELPYRLPGARRPSLSTVYVRQELGSEVDAPQHNRRIPATRTLTSDATVLDQFDESKTMPEGFGRAAAPRLSMRPPSQQVREALDMNEHLLVTGGPGQGKSTLTLRLAADIARVWLGRDEGAETVTEGDPPLAEAVIPIRLQARVLAARIDLPLPLAIGAAVSVEYGSMLSATVVSALLAERVAGCRWLLLIDAVDEIADPELRGRFVRTLSGWASGPAGCPYRLLMTSRPLESGGLAPLHRDAARFELQPFDDQTLQRFVENWFEGTMEAGESSRRFLHQIRQAHLEELVRVPLLATIAAIIFELRNDRPLPDNRYDLYQEYLAYLASARRWPTEIGEFADTLRQLRSALLEHLGTTRFHADVSLVAAAQDWVLEHTTPGGRPAAWQADLTAILRAIGLFTVRGEDLEFLHHSFADHLAATASARQLPVPFDAENPAWSQAIHMAQRGLSATHATMVLLHYTHIHPEQTDQLISWLHHNSSGFQLIAAELLSQHAPASSAVLDAFLDTARAWAMTSSGTEIFRQATHATHHPRLPEWLRQLMLEPAAPWSSRIEAATALAVRLRSVTDQNALHLLEAAMNDIALDLRDRLMAAEGMATMGPEQQEAAVRGLRAILEDANVSAYTLRAAAVALADLGPDSRDDAIHTLQETLTDPRIPPREHVQVAIGLAEISTEFHPTAVTALYRIADDASLGSYDRVNAVLALGDLGTGHLDEAATLLNRMIGDRCQPIWDRCRFAGALAELGTEYVAWASSHLLVMLEEPLLEPHERWQIASELATAYPGHHNKAAEHLRRVLVDAGINSNPRLWAAKGLADLDTNYHEEAARALLRLATDPLAEAWERSDAAGKLANLGPRYRDQAVDLLRQKLREGMADVDERLSAAGELVELGTEFHREAAASLRQIINDPASADGDRVDGAAKLVGLTATFRTQAVEVMRTILKNPAAAGFARLRAAHELAKLGPTYRTEASAGLHTLVRDRTCSWLNRINAAQYLSELGRENSGDIVTALHDMLTGPIPKPFSCEQIVRTIRRLGAEFSAETADVLRAILMDPETELDRWRLVAALAELGHEYREEAANSLYEILADPDADADSLQGAGAVLNRISSRHRVLVATKLRAVIKNPTAQVFVRVAAVKTLARLGGQHLNDAVEALKTILTVGAAPAGDRVRFASVLAALGPEPRESAITSLHAIGTEPGLSACDQLEVAWQLARADHRYLGGARSCCSRLLVNAAVATADRCNAAIRLIHHDGDSVSMVIRTLEVMLFSPMANPNDRLLLLGHLAKLKAISRHGRTQAVLGVAADPTATGHDRAQVVTRLGNNSDAQEVVALEVELKLLNDNLVTVQDRFIKPFGIHVANAPLHEEKIAALQEVIGQPEFNMEQRFAALVTLSEFGADYKRDAAAALCAIVNDMDSSANIASQAIRTLGRIDGQRRSQALALASTIGSDRTRDMRYRIKAVLAAATLGYVGEPGITLLRETVRESRASHRDQILAAIALRWLAGDEATTRLIELVYDPEVGPYYRQLSATTLIAWRPAERSAMAKILDGIASNLATSPAARWRAATALAELGEPYQDVAVAHLCLIMNDTTLPPSARTNAARAVVKVHPQHLHAAVDTLRTIAYATTTKTAGRSDALTKLGSLTRAHCDEAVAGLRAILLDDAQPAVVRWRAARAMVRLRRDTAIETALVVRQIIRNTATPWHVRSSAARALALWSPLCRDEARHILTTHEREPSLSQRDIS